jgi:riboflavin transporter FmnP
MSVSTPVGIADSKTRRKAMIRRITVTAILTAMAFVLMYLEVPLPLMPPFLKFDFSEIPVLVGAFALGPVWGIVIELLKNLIHLPFGSSAGVGELSNFILAAFFVIPAGLIYQKSKNKKGALIGSLVGALVMALVSFPSNLWFVYPAYVKVYGMPMEAIIGMYSAILPSVTTLPKALLVFNVPFTLVKGLIDVLFTFLIYKRISPLIKGTAKNA